MVANKRKKNSRQRGSKFYGAGRGSKHNKGAGNRGGRGMAGTGKRADSKKPSIWTDPYYFGKFGFRMKNPRIMNAVNIEYLENHIDKLVEQKLAREEKEGYSIDLKDIGMNKLLGYGKPTKKFKIITEFSSADAVEKIKSAGGDVTVTTKIETKEEKHKDDKKPAREAA